MTGVFALSLRAESERFYPADPSSGGLTDRERRTGKSGNRYDRGDTYERDHVIRDQFSEVVTFQKLLREHEITWK